MNDIAWLEAWYQHNCDGNWEHSYGVKIETLDNPGWHVKIDLSETNYAGLKSEELRQDADNDDWLSCSITNGIFNGYGDCKKLGVIIHIFRKWIEI